MTTTTLEHDTEHVPSETLVSAVAERKGVDPIELEPLYSVVDPDALDTIVGSGGESVELSFDYAGYRVTVEPDGVTVES